MRASRAPKALYENGLQRDLFLPFIDRLSRETRVHDMNSVIDYRRLAHHSRVRAPEAKCDVCSGVDLPMCARRVAERDVALCSVR